MRSPARRQAGRRSSAGRQRPATGRRRRRSWVTRRWPAPGRRSGSGPTRTRSSRRPPSSSATSGAARGSQGVAVMPDVHYGKGATVGSVIAMRQAISPAAVGRGHRLRDVRGPHHADRGRPARRSRPDCGARSRPRSRSASPMHDDPVNPAPDPGAQAGRLGRLLAPVPHPRPVGVGARDPGPRSSSARSAAVTTSSRSALEQGGPDDGQVWLMLHSGSRNIGKELAERHMAIARTLPHNTDLPDRNLAVFLAGTPEMAAYRRDLWWAQEYARRNREVMLALLCGVLRQQFPRVGYDEPISCHHNYVAEETLRRGGAAGHPQGRDPGRRTASWASSPARWAPAPTSCAGRGNPDAYCSASHGAGRRMSRSAGEEARTAPATSPRRPPGWSAARTPGVVDEIPSAYKDINAGDGASSRTWSRWSPTSSRWSA